METTDLLYLTNTAKLSREVELKGKAMTLPYNTTVRFNMWFNFLRAYDSWNEASVLCKNEVCFSSAPMATPLSADHTFCNDDQTACLLPVVVYFSDQHKLHSATVD